MPMQVRGSGGSPALHTGGQAARVRARAFALRPFGLPAPSALAARRLPVAAQRRSDAHQTLHLEVDSRGRCSAVAGHGLVIRHELASQRAGELAGADYGVTYSPVDVGPPRRDQMLEEPPREPPVVDLRPLPPR